MDEQDSIGHACGVVIYDGACAFCRKQAARIRAWDTRGRFELVARQTPGLEERFPKLAQADFNTGMRVVLRSGEIPVGADAAYEIARGLPRTRWFAWIYRVPGLKQIARGAYGWVAANRYRLSGKCETGSCAVGLTKDEGRATSDE
jgi:predicted DCC family thiol-disulfide oxidoreductase YuxK